MRSASILRALAALALVVALGAIFHADGAFFRWGTHRDMLRHVSVYAILGCGMTLVVVSGGIDLSVGSVLAVSAVVFSLLTIHRGVTAWVAAPACLLAGAGAGALNGAVIARFGVQPFIATLGMMVFARGAAKWLTGGQKISTAVLGPDGSYEFVPVPASFDVLASGVLGQSVAVVTLVFLACFAVSWVVLARHRVGRHIYAVGGNEEAARLSGVPVLRTKVLAYGLAGLMSAVAGICQAAQEQQGDPEAGLGYELTAIAMVVLGGTSLAGGRGGAGFTLLGVLTMGYLEKVLSINAVGEASRMMLTGAILVLAVLFQRARR